MTNRRKRIYEIALIVCCFIIIGLSAYMGITAIQKSMTLKLDFKATPSILCQIDIKASGSDDSTYSTIFNNGDNPVIGSGLSLNGDSLRFSEDFAMAYSGVLGNSFTLKITNLRDDLGIKITSSGTSATSNPLSLKLQAGGVGTMDVSGVAAISNLQFTITEYNSHTISFSGGVTNTNTEITSGENYSTILTVQNGYKLPSSITVMVGGVEISDYTYNPTTGLLTINSQEITGDITINAVATAISYTITYNLTDCFSSNTSDSIKYGTAYETTLTVSTGYNLPSSVTITIGGATTSNYSYTSSIGALTINADAVTGNVVINAVATAKTYTITYNLTGCTSSNTSDSIKYGTAYETTLTVSTGYNLPSSVTITIGGATTSNYSYTPSTGVLSINAGVVTGNIVINVVATVKMYTITLGVRDASSSNTATSIQHGTEYRTTLITQEGFEVFHLYVIVNGMGTNDYSFNSSTGELIIYASAVTGDITIGGVAEPA